MFLRAVPGLPIEAQRSLIRERVGTGVEYIAGKDATMRDLWAKQARPGDRCAVARMSLIAEPKRPKGRPPTVDMGAVTTGLMARGCVVIDVLGEVTSADNGRFAKRFEGEMNVVRSGRRLGTAEARKRGKAGAKKRWSGIRSAEAWDLPELAPLKAKLQVPWKSRAYKNDAEAAEAVNAMLLDMGQPPLGSKESVRRRLGPRK